MKQLFRINKGQVYQLDSTRDRGLAPIPTNTYIIASEFARNIHFDPLLAGTPLQKLATKCSEQFLSVASRLHLLDSISPADLSQVLILSGGYYYRLADAFYGLYSTTLPTGFLGIKRQFEGNIPTAIVSYVNLEAIHTTTSMLIADTIGTGATIERAIQVLLEWIVRHNISVKQILVYSIAGAYPGANRLALLEETALRQLKIDLHVFFMQAIFGLAENNIDMKYYHCDTIVPDDVTSLIVSERDKLIASEMCAIWDWGERNNDPDTHWKNVIEACNTLVENGPDKHRLKLLEELRSLATNARQSYREPLSQIRERG